MDRMPPVPEKDALSADPPRVNDYDILAEAYTAENEDSLINAYYARPAILALAGDVAGRRILDAGCGSGPLFAALRDRGAIVTGFDSSTRMLEQACSPSSSRPRRASCASCSSSCTPANGRPSPPGAQLEGRISASTLPGRSRAAASG
jgi:SAM-dependent methyltransferase